MQTEHDSTCLLHDQNMLLHIRRTRQKRRCLDETCRLILVQALVISRLDYCNFVLSGPPSSTLQRLSSVLHILSFILNIYIAPLQENYSEAQNCCSSNERSLSQGPHHTNSRNCQGIAPTVETGSGGAGVGWPYLLTTTLLQKSCQFRMTVRISNCYWGW